MNRILVIGHSDAGISAALFVKEVAPLADVTVVVAKQYPNFSSCGCRFGRAVKFRTGKRWPTELQPIRRAFLLWYGRHYGI